MKNKTCLYFKSECRPKGSNCARCIVRFSLVQYIWDNVKEDFAKELINRVNRVVRKKDVSID